MKFDLVFEGGGAKGMIFVGALQEFEARGNTHGRLLGTSAGAITATLLAAGYGSQEMLEALAEKQDGKSVFTSFMGTPAPFTKEEILDSDILTLLKSIDIPLIPEAIEEKLDDKLIGWLAKQPRSSHLVSFVERGGWYSADNFIRWLQTKLDSGKYKRKPRQFSGITLEQFYAATRKDLSLVVSDTTGESMLVVNHRTAPECPLVWAVRMSMSIPLLWQEVVWQKEWGLYLGQDITGHTIVDGGLLSNFPIELFLSSLENVTALMGPKGDAPVMGLLIDETLPVPGAEQPAAQKPSSGIGELQTVRRISNLVNTLLSAHDKMVMDAFEKLVVHLPAQGYGTTEFDMSDERRELLVAAGQKTMSKYLDQRAMVSFAVVDEAEEDRAAETANKIAARILGRTINQKLTPA
ncbi:hypothetical protein GW866_03325 [bacterium]|nr:hypothetical protein [bacterium]OIO90255.1 MAG: hypothetical protein AUK02_01350 [Anaerolineae bacterium CG2_30_58_95]PIU90869.1 MAG: hypothetical protein COS63_02350 [Anaerolineae bacterium CG06_land_8_20_14_3_00_57_67]PIW19249.1 MAG: hypothetical protein COW33_05105 [Anaerolineae bacterium CG17_big_fil_post_rev_8_21_14_2_50_57_27]